LNKKIEELLKKGKVEKAEEYKIKHAWNRFMAQNVHKAQEEIDEMGAAEQQFRFQQSDRAYGYTSYDKDGTTVINYLDNIANTVHELKHAHQNLKGQITGVPGSDKAEHVDLTDEVQAYIRQFCFNPFSMPTSTDGSAQQVDDITIYWVKGVYNINSDGSKEFLYKDNNIPFRLDKNGSYSTDNPMIRQWLSHY
jgi:hypothetical protein